ncbi:hypothetical protein PYW07_000404 [Mythimna separata]|uniref:Uncharacterized protein n=1 Tax=Mythimna separata TaxID=271217 RepID=A0AAD7Z1I3_MYTSE|nr:hypothetical protein PYW07_000404 [Mythimna separata]
MFENPDENSWESRRTSIIAILSQTMGVSTMLYLPNMAVIRGALAHVLLFALVYVALGVPLLYMELVVGQFTGRDCLEVWHARACLAHIGYAQVFWHQFIERAGVANIIAEVLYSLNVGTGLAFGTASRTSFRAPTYANAVIVVAITACCTIFGTCTTAMMTCPYAFRYNTQAVLLEIIVFVLWYGLDRFSEDVHFMQGVQPSTSMKAGWLLSAVALVYVFIVEFYGLYKARNKTVGYLAGWYMLLLNIIPILLLVIVRILIALYKNKFYEEVGLDSSWGPTSELLRRSRAMFTAQAMTKEYMYRQYHLQAGILKRQRRSNVRSCYRPVLPPKTEGVRFETEST